mmetsp:Transcript_23515/g.23181  ORF Transcript_23515/g.23181 Transcript_23515/m.23181 type:complete len:221 (-) Transcript_23515:59-721(-)
MHFPGELKDKWGENMREDIIDQIEIINLYFNKIRTIQEQEVEKGQHKITKSISSFNLQLVAEQQRMVTHQDDIEIAQDKKRMLEKQSKSQFMKKDAEAVLQNNPAKKAVGNKHFNAMTVQQADLKKIMNEDNSSDGFENSPVRDLLKEQKKMDFVNEALDVDRFLPMDTIRNTPVNSEDGVEENFAHIKERDDDAFFSKQFPASTIFEKSNQKSPQNNRI